MALISVTKWVSLSAVDTVSIATVWTPATGKRIRFMGGSISCSTAINILFEDNAAAAGNFLFRTPKLLVDTPYSFSLGPHGKSLAAVGNLLKATGSAAGLITGTLWGVEEGS